MKESFENVPVTEQEVVEALDTKGIEDEGVKELLGKFVDQCHQEADAKAAEDPDSSNRANIEAEIKLATMWSKTRRYKDQARESFVELLAVAKYSDSTEDLVNIIMAQLVFLKER